MDSCSPKAHQRKVKRNQCYPGLELRMPIPLSTMITAQRRTSKDLFLCLLRIALFEIGLQGFSTQGDSKSQQQTYGLTSIRSSRCTQMYPLLYPNWHSTKMVGYSLRSQSLTLTMDYASNFYTPLYSGGVLIKCVCIQINQYTSIFLKVLGM